MRWVSVRSDIDQEVEVVAELAAEQVLGVEAVLDFIDGVAHSEVMTVSWLRCHQPS